MKTKILLLFVIIAIIFFYGKDGEGPPKCLLYMSQNLSEINFTIN